jgi:hypothetical protein
MYTVAQIAEKKKKRPGKRTECAEEEGRDKGGDDVAIDDPRSMWAGDAREAATGLALVRELGHICCGRGRAFATEGCATLEESESGLVDVLIAGEQRAASTEPVRVRHISSR